MKHVDAIITDLDDTLWDWLTMWYNSFSPLISSISQEFDIPLEDLKKDFSSLHTKYHTSEASFILEEIDSLNSEQIDAIKSNPYHEGKSIMHIYNSNKKYSTRLYPDVRETLKTLKKYGVKIVGFTESKSFYTSYRIKHTELDGLIDVVYTPKDHDLPVNFEKYYDDNYWELNSTKLELLHGEFKKPDKKILLDILKTENIDINKSIYVGDKIQRDVYMANEAGITSVHAEYGHVIDDCRYSLLRDVTHWTAEEVQAEKDFKNKMKGMEIKADHTINMYKELLDLFDFIPFS